MLIHRK